ncbi:unnamed protein product [Ectocarpus sp. CCAP 1310/34]|nr:unnamed protein product [Ectocarpus sp. CCAP 1310/34]
MSMGSMTSCESLLDADLGGAPRQVLGGGGGAAPERVAIVGSGNWGSAIARIVGRNVIEQEGFEHQIRQWVFPEKVSHNGVEACLTEVINREHENVKYLPGVKLPENLVAEGDLALAVKDATILIFVLPHQFLGRVLPTVAEALGLTKSGGNAGAAPGGRRIRAVSLIKGVDKGPDGLKLISDHIREGLCGAVPVSVLMGANVANEVARDELCESTLGLADEDYASCRAAGLSVTADADTDTLRLLFNRPTFRVTVVRDASATVELCGALKNVVALGAAFCDGLGYGGNTKAAIVRTGLAEMQVFAQRLRCDASSFDATASSRAFLESCGIGDLMTTCYGASRNRKCAEMFARESGKRSWEQLEAEELGGMKLQGPSTAVEAFGVIKKKKCARKFPLLTTIYRIAHEGQSAKTIVEFDKVQA